MYEKFKKEVRQKPDDKLKELLKDKKLELYKLNAKYQRRAYEAQRGKSTGDSHKRTKRHIAIIKTILNERNLKIKRRDGISEVKKT